MLLASPDDDIDPVSPKKWYDPGVYHKFARPVGWQKPRQSTLSRPPVENEWVVVRDYTSGDHDLDGAEGRAVSVREQSVVVALSDGIAGSSTGERHVEVPLDRVHVMVFDSLRRGDPVSIIRGRDAGRVGIVQEFKSGSVEVLVANTDLLTVPVERLQKIHE